MKRTNTIINHLLIVCFILMLLVIWKTHYRHFETMKECIFAFSILISVGLLAISATIYGHPVFRKNRLTVAVLLYCTYNVLSFLIFPYTDPKYFFLFTCLIAEFFVISAVTDLRYRDEILYVVIITALFISIYGCFQFFGIDFPGFSAKEFSHRTIAGAGRALSTLRNPNDMGGFCVFMLPISAAFTLQSRLEKRRILTGVFGVVFFLLLLALFMCETRGSWIAFCCSVGIFVTLYWRKRLLTVWANHVFISLVGFLLAVILLYGAFFVTTTYISLFNTWTLNIRLFYHKTAIAIFKDHPLFGKGIGTFEIYYPVYRDSRAAARIGEASFNLRIVHAHNEHLETLCEGGIVGYGLFLWIVFEAVFSLLKRRGLIELGLTVAILGLLCDGVFSENLRHIPISSLFWLTIGFANISDCPLPAASRPKKLKFIRIISVVSIVVATAIPLQFVFRLFFADRDFQTGMTLYFNRRYPQAIRWFHKSLSWYSEDKVAMYVLAVAYELNSDTDRAIEYYIRVLDIDPHFPETNYRLAKVYLAEGNTAKAKNYFEKEIAVNNMRWDAYYRLALLEHDSGNTEQAITYLKEIEHIQAIRPIRPRDMIKRVREFLAEMENTLRNEGNLINFSSVNEGGTNNAVNKDERDKAATRK